jgi:uncharacterized DUF497 family protein
LANNLIISINTTAVHIVVKAVVGRAILKLIRAREVKRKENMENASSLGYLFVSSNG